MMKGIAKLGKLKLISYGLALLVLIGAGAFYLINGKQSLNFVTQAIRQRSFQLPNYNYMPPVPATPACTSLSVNPNNGEARLNANYSCQGTISSNYKVTLTLQDGVTTIYTTANGFLKNLPAGIHQLECAVGSPASPFTCKTTITVTPSTTSHLECDDINHQCKIALGAGDNEDGCNTVGQTCATISPVPTAAQCGSAQGPYPFPSSSFGLTPQFCNPGVLVGMPNFPAPDASISRKCLGIGGGASTTCSASQDAAPIPTVGECGSAAGSYHNPSPAGFGAHPQFCLVGTPLSWPIFPTVTQPASWVCQGIAGGDNTTCHATLNNTHLACIANSCTIVQGAGANEASCTSPLQACLPPDPGEVDGKCGSSAGLYPVTTTSFPLPTQFCEHGNLVGGTPLFPASARGSVSRTCAGANGGATSLVCKATRGIPPLPTCPSSATIQGLPSAGGTVAVGQCPATSNGTLASSLSQAFFPANNTANGIIYDVNCSYAGGLSCPMTVTVAASLNCPAYQPIGNLTNQGGNLSITDCPLLNGGPATAVLQPATPLPNNPTINPVTWDVTCSYNGLLCPMETKIPGVTLLPENGSCGGAAKAYTHDVSPSLYSSSLCWLGNGVPTPTNPTFPGVGGTISRTCGGSNGGDPSPTCTATRDSKPECGTAQKQYASTDTNFGNLTFCKAPATVVLTPNFPNSPGGSVTWQCKSPNGGAPKNCTATRALAEVNGQCGPAADTYAHNDSTYAGVKCSAGIQSPPTVGFPAIGGTVTWVCEGSNGGSDMDCEANRENPPKVDGVCNPAVAKEYEHSAPDLYAPGPKCLVGTPDPLTQPFPLPGAIETRTCAGQFNGATVTCTAKQKQAPSFDLSLTKVLTSKFSNIYKYRIDIKNEGTISAKNFTLKDYAPENSVVSYRSAGGIYGSNYRTVTRTIVELKPGETKSYIIELKNLVAQNMVNRAELCDYNEPGEPQTFSTTPCNMGPTGNPSEVDEADVFTAYAP